MSEPLIRVAENAGEIEAVRGLFRAYGSYLAGGPSGAAGIYIENLESEVAALPAGYSLLLLASVGGEAAGCVALKPLDRMEERAGELKRLWVASPFRGLRLGSALVEAAIQAARQTGLQSLFLDTVPAAMPEAHRLYERLGFLRVERYNRNPVADVVFFRLNL